MIYAFLVGFLLGALLVNMYLKEEEKANNKLIQDNLELKDEIDRLNYLEESRRKEKKEKCLMKRKKNIVRNKVKI